MLEVSVNIISGRDSLFHAERYFSIQNNFIEKKTEQSKDSLIEIAMKYTYDPFVKSIVEILNLDKTNLDTLHESYNASIKSIFSPLKYLKENLVLFNVNNRFYIKKGSHIQKLNESQINTIDNNFKNLCYLINDSRVEMDDKKIFIYHGNDICQINENNIHINGEEISLYHLKKLNEAASMIGDKKSEMYMMVESLYRNFDNIANIEFVKHIELNENENAFADIFKLNQKVYINLKGLDGHETFYKNVNPIQAKNIILENLNYDITPIFKDVMPKEQLILKEMAETKKAYLDYINNLEQKIKLFENVNQDVVSALNEELNSTKAEMLDYTKKCDEYQHINEDFTVTITDDNKNTHTFVIPTQTSQQNEQPANNEQPAEEAPQDEPNEETNDEASSEDSLDFDDINVSDDEIENNSENNSAVVDFEESDEEVEESYIEEKFNKKYQQPKPEKKSMKVFIRKKKSDTINESLNVYDSVNIQGKGKGKVVGVHANGDIIITTGDGSTIVTKPQKVTKIVKQKIDSPISVLKFDSKTLKALYEQAVRCGVYMNNVPVKTHNCYVNYAEYKAASDNDNVNVLIEGEKTLLNKSCVRVFESEDEFANPSDYVEGVLINPETGEAVKNVLINAPQYTSSYGEADEINILVDDENNQRQLMKVAKGLLKTTAI